MKFLTTIALIVITACYAHADSGGPYQGVPDLRTDEEPPTFQIPVTKEPLRHYLQHMPKLNLNPKYHEPDSYTWEKISGYHASFRVLGHVRGRELYEVRYVSDRRINQGLDYADAILILARGEDNGADQERLEAIYYSSGGTSYDRRAEYFPEGDKSGAVKITDWWSGTGWGRWRIVYIRRTEESAFQRFTPEEEEHRVDPNQE